MTTATGAISGTAPNQVIHAGNGIHHAYREIGSSTVPLVLLEHIHADLGNWDFHLVDPLAALRRVVAFDIVGIGATTGTTPSSCQII
jgi:pimeloyl-ACP methyl ester carboxylesterase